MEGPKQLAQADEISDLHYSSLVGLVGIKPVGILTGKSVQTIAEFEVRTFY